MPSDDEITPVGQIEIGEPRQAADQSGGADEPKGILFDADGDAADMTMSTTELTQSGVLARMQSEVPEPLYSEALEYLMAAQVAACPMPKSRPI